MSVETRIATESEYPDWLRALATGFLRPPAITDEEIALRRAHTDLSRVRGAFDDGRCVATYRTFGQQLTVPGGGPVAANAVSNVTVSPTHRRRGLLSRMMTADLAEAKERGDVVSTLIAAEYPIYGRYGFGPAAWLTEWSVDVPRTGIDPRWSGPSDGGRVDLVDGTDVRKLGPELHQRLAAVQPGFVSRDERWWQLHTGQALPPGDPWTEPFYAVYRAASGEIEGLLSYRADDRWGDAKQPLNTASVRELLALTPAAERALWHFVCSVDWITTVKSGSRAPDDLLPAPPGPEGSADPDARRLPVGADPGRRTGAGSAYVRGLGHAGAGAPRPDGPGGRPLPPGRVPGGRDLRPVDGRPGSDPGHRGVGDAVPGRRVGGTADGARPGGGERGGSGAGGGRGVPYVEARVVPGRLLTSARCPDIF